MLKKIKAKIKRYILNVVKNDFYTNSFDNFKKVGKSVELPPALDCAGCENISIGSNVYIGPRCCFLATKAELIIGNHVMIGPEVMIITGDHRIDLKNIYMDEVNEEMTKPGQHLPVIIEDDVWICARVTILKGIKIGKGSVIAAGAVVLKNVPPYSIYYNKNDIRPRFK